jgi:uncharacterized RDD family membrane protein YckC
MTNEITITSTEEIKETEYAGAGVRISAGLLDYLILLPIVFLLMYLESLIKNMYYAMLLPNMALFLWFNIFLVKKYGGTPGKIFMKIKIVKTDESDITYKEAFMRSLIAIITNLGLTVVSIMAISKMDIQQFESVIWYKQNQYFTSYYPIFNLWREGILIAYIFVDLIIFLSNKKYRTIEDFIANTVVVRNKNSAS